MPLNELLAEAARRGQEINPCFGKMCSDCAFRIQPDINGYSEAVNAAMDLLVCNPSNAKFHCHTKDYEDAGRACAGFLYAKQYYEKMEKELDIIDQDDLRKEIAEEAKAIYKHTFYDKKEAELFENEISPESGPLTLK